jgi:tRNA (guanine9-N1)-methyltransferase
MDSSTTSYPETTAREGRQIKADGRADEVVPPVASDPSVQQAARGVKRSAEENADDHNPRASCEVVELIEQLDENDEAPPPLSKNQQRKLKRRKVWEDKKAERTLQRKDKRHEKRERKRLEYEQACAQAAAEGRPPPERTRPERERNPEKQTRVPVSIVIDCQFESYMLEKELVSMSSQVTRCYSDNRTARFPVHLYVSSFGGTLQKRYDEVQGGQYNRWKGICFAKEDFVEASKLAQEAMSLEQGGSLAGALAEAASTEEATDALTILADSNHHDKKQGAIIPEPEPEDVDHTIVYLTADSPYTLERLSANTTYVVGGIIDRNREKGLCYKIARQRKVRTAKLPIGEYMVLRDRHVLTTNQVVEIMLRWLEEGDWGAAFMKVIPQRKGGQLKAEEEDGDKPAIEQSENGEAELLLDADPADIQNTSEA